MIVRLWQLFGWFYVSLAVALLGYFLVSKNNKRLIKNLAVTVCFSVGLYYSLIFVVSYGPKTANFFKGWNKVETVTSGGQNRFAEFLDEVLPLSASGCVLWHNDVPTVYLISELYPRHFIGMDKGADLSDCKVVVDPEKHNVYATK